MAVSYNDFISAVTNYYNAQAGISEGAWASGATWTQISTDFGRVGINTDTYIKYLEDFPELFEITRNVDGTILDASLKKYSYYGNVSTSAGSSLNSNTVGSTLLNSTGLNISGITSVSTTGAFEVTGGIGLKADTGLTTTGVVRTVGAAVAAVATGATLGKIIGDGLYQANPNFWATPNLENLSQTDWNKFAVTVKDDVGTLVNKGILALWGIEDDTTTMYLDENAVAYLALYMQQNGVFAKSTIVSDGGEVDGDVIPSGFTMLRDVCNNRQSGGYYTSGNAVAIGTVRPYVSELAYLKSYTNGSDLGLVRTTNYGFVIVNFNDSGFRGGVITEPAGSNVFDGSSYTYTYENKTVNYFFVTSESVGSSFEWNLVPSTYYTSLAKLAWFVRYGAFTEKGGLDGITNQEDATLPDLSTATTPEDVLNLLKTQYPELWENAVKRNTVQDDGSSDERTYIPVAIPKFNNPFDEQPTTGTPTQKNPSINPDTTPEDELQDTTNTVTKDPTSEDDPNTGGGSTPSITSSTQSASALWAIYNPTLAELNQLGAWLWSDNFLDQIKKIFNDPMQAIIGLHKIYAQPSISDAQNIKVGYLDTGVNSNVVGNQYTYIDCGSVSLREYYGNVLDYAPYTDARLYLPFIGIVPLDIADVSRGTISVRYGVDVLTGACIANVNVQRDNAGGVLYAYTGNCAAQYPLSSGSYLGMLSGAVSAVGNLATGNLIGAMGSALSMRTNVEHSGAFTGNAGAMGCKIPYLIVSRPQSAMNSGFPAIQGYPSNVFVQLKNCTGYVQVRDCHVENIPATSAELDLIKSLLMEGVIL